MQRNALSRPPEELTCLNLELLRTQIRTVAGPAFWPRHGPGTAGCVHREPPAMPCISALWDLSCASEGMCALCRLNVPKARKSRPKCRTD
ncbi:hypothetical protein P152DRAFT_456245 [Eremomyces bilateralis CBS 781.70]|uniref:Uncharacterized protein n=1 Tax=Eremomyces bilateralis CBS 781.70 TaxID=1392243 RepID=A0A6G1GB34_9PEZI|nr:uncharacterized protein P152DRAFT_456245 [Eremomyces bilateralis CBS 781.70]KAF1815192.1 hypothetical protein P152DRAFT_456245 [Eremomyces bilateralis CBS 781.70]